MSCWDRACMEAHDLQPARSAAWCAAVTTSHLSFTGNSPRRLWFVMSLLWFIVLLHHCWVRTQNSIYPKHDWRPVTSLASSSDYIILLSFSSLLAYCWLLSHKDRPLLRTAPAWHAVDNRYLNEWTNLLVALRWTPKSLSIICNWSLPNSWIHL